MSRWAIACQCLKVSRCLQVPELGWLSAIMTRQGPPRRMLSRRLKVHDVPRATKNCETLLRILDCKFGQRALTHEIMAKLLFSALRRAVDGRTRLRRIFLRLRAAVFGECFAHSSALWPRTRWMWIRTLRFCSRPSGGIWPAR